MSKTRPLKPLISIVGATGTGKSALAVALAGHFAGEIINADAIQLYKGLPIITNKISEEEQSGIPHHLLNIIGFQEEPWTVGTFVNHALDKIREIRSRGNLPILVGGTHYYIQSLLFEDFMVPSVDEAESLMVSSSHSEILQRPTTTLIEQLRAVDPVMADRWHPNDRRKIQRSLEIYLTTGRKASDIYMEQIQKAGRISDDNTENNVYNIADAQTSSLLMFWTHCSKQTLDERLNGRVDKMLERGLRNEVRLIDEYLEQNSSSCSPSDKGRGIWIAIGYKEFDALRRAQSDNVTDVNALALLHTEAIDQIKAHTRQYAKAQIRWIERKLVSALCRTKQSDRLFVLDAHNLESWTDTVCRPAVEITEKFLTSQQLPDPAEVYPFAAEALHRSKASFDLGKSPDKWFRKECELCHMAAVTELDWEQHNKSRKHRNQMKKLNRATEWTSPIINNASTDHLQPL
ncbi:MAG: hypothetical protein M1814_001577 [Vezdaea aestivalis]|nr:MAG: hypothetical protein M1814_001577 [Vezdaea aestivalis]